MLLSPPPMLAEWSGDSKPLATAVHAAMDKEHPIFESPIITNLIVSYLEVNPLKTHTVVALRDSSLTRDPSLTLEKIQTVEQRELFPDLAMRSRDSAHCVNFPSSANGNLVFMDTEYYCSAPTQQAMGLQDSTYHINLPFSIKEKWDVTDLPSPIKERWDVTDTEPEPGHNRIRTRRSFTLDAEDCIMTQALKDDSGEIRAVPLNRSSRS